MTEDKLYILNQIIEKDLIYPVFQPIVSLKDGDIIGYEALSRISGGSSYEIAGIEELFSLAEEAQSVWKLDYICRKHAISKAFQNAMFDQLLFINVSPKIIEDTRFSAGFTKEYLKRFHASPDKIVFEITEKQAIKNKQDFKRIVDNYKNQEYSIAIDDAGSGHSGLERICNIMPKYIKIDIELIRNIHKSRVKASLVKALVEFANTSNIKLIAEGIEIYEELEKLIEIGVHYGQGYLLGRPIPEIQDISEDIKKMIYDLNFQNYKVQKFGIDRYFIKNICREVLLVSRHKNAGELLDNMMKNPEVKGVCVIEDDCVVGMLTRERFLQLLGGRYGFYMYQNKEVGFIMKKDFLSVDWEMSIGRVSEIAMERKEAELYDFIVVTSKDKYYGVVTIKDLLRKATQINIMAARDANPLTGLPGNNEIEKELIHCISGKSKYSVIYLDLDNFKAYNDVYGFENGDKVIKLLANITSEVIGADGFVGHIGGDDFVIIVHHCNAEEYIEVIQSKFENQVKVLYTQEDRNRGYIVTTDRRGDMDFFPLVTVTIVMVSSEECEFCSQNEISEELAFLKKKEKKIKHMQAMKKQELIMPQYKAD